MQIGKKTRAVSAALILLAPALAHALAVGSIEGKSYLNQPLEARIPLTAVTAAELKSLRINLAPSEVYQRAGIDLGPEQAGLQFQLVIGEGAPYVRVTSRDSIRDPFLTFLVEISWAEGRLVREYTLLIDPPTLMAPARPPETRQPVVQPKAPPDVPEVAQAPEITPLPEPTPSRVGPTQTSTAEADPSAGLRVRRGDTLWAIASGNNTDEAVNINQMMLAIYARNPQAFNGNINRLKAGAILRMPSADEIRAISRAAALVEVRRQNEAWRAGRTTQLAKKPSVPSATQAEAAPKALPAPTRPRLELVAPDEAELAAAPPAGTGMGDVATDTQGVTSTGQAETGSAGPGGESAGLVQMDSATALALQTPLDATPEANSSAGLAEPDTLQALPPQAAASPEVPVDPVQSPTPAQAVDAAEGESGLLGSWWLALVAAAAGLLGWLFWRRRQAADPQEEEIDFVLNSDGEDRLTATAPHMTGGNRQEPVWAEDKDFSGGGHEPEPDTQPGLSSFSPETPLGVDQEDPLAEADFNLTYGLFDEALAVVEQALTRQPERRDLKLKRLEVLFAASDKAGFLKHAQALAAEPQGQADSAWERCMMMGQQMLPDEPLFKNAPPLSMAGGDFLDLDLGPSGASDAVWAGSDPDRNEQAPHADGEAATEILGRRPDLALSPEPGVELSAATDPGDLPFEFSAGDLEPEAETQSENTIEKHLDMARVYLGMEEFTAARRELEQALLEGTAEQQAEAHELMGQVEGRAGMVDNETAQALMVDVPGTGTLDIEDFGTRDDHGTRLDLARQYMELDDVDGARTLIEEVIKEGSPDQRREAETL
ncbi:MAG: FimV/HubP family polar landmark protein, partial [Candidatus Macondimonas sp.]